MNVGILNLSMTNPAANSLTSVPSGNSINVTATTNVNATFQLKANGSVVHSTSTPSTSYSYSYTVTGDANMELIATDANSNTKNATFILQVPRNVISEAIPSWIKQGINYHPTDQTKVGLALYAPFKNFVHVIGSFNNWTVNDTYLMKRDTTNPDLYWIELSGLTHSSSIHSNTEQTTLERWQIHILHRFYLLMMISGLPLPLTRIYRHSLQVRALKFPCLKLARLLITGRLPTSSDRLKIIL